MYLVIVESPTKAKTIGKFLGSKYKVESSYGHVRDLPKSKLGIDVENNFEPHYIVPKKAQKNVTHLKKISAKAKEIILASDEDREGEAIAWHILQVLSAPKKNGKKVELPPIKRIVFHEITKSAIESALESPRQIDSHLVDAQQARRVLDRLVGYNLSPFLWKKIMRGLSAGRVQSVALRLIVEREEEIRAFKPEEYWTIGAEFGNKKGEIFEGNLSKVNGKTVPKPGFKSKEEVEKIVEELKGLTPKIGKIAKKEVRKSPLPPFTTSTLQQEAAKKLGYSSKKTMFLAQRLYENGLITYMRTDSVNLSQESLNRAREWITSNYGESYAVSSPRVFKGKSKLAQEAHEAIRPTDCFKQPEDLNLEVGEKKVYDLVRRRFLASQLPEAVFESTSADIEAGDYLFKASGNVLRFDGFLKMWPSKFEETELPVLQEGEALDFRVVKPEQHFTQPPARYNEASLIKTLEENGIGRPSTYAPTISVILNRNYVEKNEQRRLQPTEIGEKVNKILIEHFPSVVDIQFTAKMENELDEVAEGKKNWPDLMKEFYEPFAENLKEKYETVPENKPAIETTDIKCEKCGKPMIIRTGRFGRFLACSGFPECKNTKSLKDDKKSFGKCPKCGEGEVIQRRTKKKRIFYGCSKYPDCDYASWKAPKSEESQN